MEMPNNFVESTFKYFIRFLKENDLYTSLHSRLTKQGFKTLNSLMKREKNFLNDFCHPSFYPHSINMIRGVNVIVDKNNFSEGEYTYFLLIRQLNQLYLCDTNNSITFISLHEKMFIFACDYYPNLKKYRTF